MYHKGLRVCSSCQGNIPAVSPLIPALRCISKVEVRSVLYGIFPQVVFPLSPSMPAGTDQLEDVFTAETWCKETVLLETSVLQQKLEPPGYQFPSPAGKDALSLDVCNARVSLKAISQWSAVKLPRLFTAAPCSSYELLSSFKRQPCLCTEMQKKPATSASRLWGLVFLVRSEPDCQSCGLQTDEWVHCCRGRCTELCVDFIVCVLELHGRNTFFKQP